MHHVKVGDTGKGSDVSPYTKMDQAQTRAANAREASRRSDILQAARELFVRFGYKKTTMEDIARAAGITKPTIYTYFEGKKDIMVSLVEWEAQQVLDVGLSQVKTDAGAPEQLAAMFTAADEFLEKDSFLKGIAMRDPDILTPEVISLAFAYERRIIEAMAGILEQGMEEGTVRRTDPKLLAYAIVRLHEAFTFTSFFDEEGFDPGEIRDFLIQTMFAAVKL